MSLSTSEAVDRSERGSEDAKLRARVLDETAWTEGRIGGDTLWFVHLKSARKQCRSEMRRMRRTADARDEPRLQTGWRLAREGSDEAQRTAAGSAQDDMGDASQRPVQAQ